MLKHENCILSLEVDLTEIRKQVEEYDPKVHPEKHANAKRLEIEFVSAIRILKLFDSLDI